MCNEEERSMLYSLKDTLTAIDALVCELEGAKPYFCCCMETMISNIDLFFISGEDDEEQIKRLLRRDWKNAHGELLGIQFYDPDESGEENRSEFGLIFAILLGRAERTLLQITQGSSGACELWTNDEGKDYFYRIPG